MSGALRVAVVFGGPSPEAEVSRVSARAVVSALSEAGHQVSEHELGPKLAQDLERVKPEVVFPVSHGTLGEDGCLQGLLEVLGLPYVGSDVPSSACAANKVLAKMLFKARGLPVAPHFACEQFAEAEAASVEIAALGPGWVVKPANGGSAIGVRLVPAGTAMTEVLRNIKETLAEDRQVLVEPLLSGLEVTCGVLDARALAPLAMPPTLIVPQAAEWYDFRSKYASGGSKHQCPAPFAPALNQRIQELALGAHRAVGARDLSRSDFIVSDVGEAATVTLLEINTLPGMTATSLFPEAARAAGIAFPELCDRLLRLALARPRSSTRIMAMP